MAGTCQLLDCGGVGPYGDGTTDGGIVITFGPDFADNSIGFTCCIWLGWRAYDGVHDARALIRHLWRCSRRRRATGRATGRTAVRIVGAPYGGPSTRVAGEADGGPFRGVRSVHG